MGITGSSGAGAVQINQPFKYHPYTNPLAYLTASNTRP